MSKLEDIQKAVELPPAKLTRFRKWFEEFDAALFDAKIERDMHADKLEKFAKEAIREFRSGRARQV
jgi:hypothetical protein